MPEELKQTVNDTSRRKIRPNGQSKLHILYSWRKIKRFEKGIIKNASILLVFLLAKPVKGSQSFFDCFYVPSCYHKLMVELLFCFFFKKPDLRPCRWVKLDRRWPEEVGCSVEWLVCQHVGVFHDSVWNGFGGKRGCHPGACLQRETGKVHPPVWSPGRVQQHWVSCLHRFHFWNPQKSKHASSSIFFGAWNVRLYVDLYSGFSVIFQLSPR